MSAAPEDDPKTVLTNQHIRVKSCRYGPMAYNIGDTYIGRSFDLYGEYVEEESRMLDQLLRPGMIALDIGANIGAHTIFMTKKVSPGGLVVAFEPQREIFQLLCANVALNALHNVHTHHAALGAELGEIIVPFIDYEKGGNFGGLTLGNHDKGETVPCRTIDDMKLRRCDVMKIDVEGMENEVIIGATQSIEKYRPALYIENDRRERSEELLTRLFDLNYRIFWHLPRLYNPANFFENHDNEFGNLISRNILCIPKERNISIEKMQEITDPAEDF